MEPSPAPVAGLYIHVPFCRSICPYCDFAREVGADDAVRRYVHALKSEAERHTGLPRAFDTVYFGGGTPSALPAGDIEELLECARRSFTVRRETRVFLEANPGDVTPEHLSTWRGLGVGTLSIGVQSFDREELAFLGRRHDSSTARRAVTAALERGFECVSVDLIFGLPGQLRDRWESTLDETIRLEPHHVSCYQLTIHDETPFGMRRATGALGELDEDAQAVLFEAAHDRLEAAGYEAYEVSNFARSREHRSRHNEKYWNHTPYLGLGPSAHSYHDRRRWWNEREFRDYERRIARGEAPIAGEEVLSARQLAMEAVFLGLRRTEGVDLRAFRDTFGTDIVDANRSRVERYVAEGLASLDGARLRLTRRGLALADGIAASLDV